MNNFNSAMSSSNLMDPSSVEDHMQSDSQMMDESVNSEKPIDLDMYFLDNDKTPGEILDEFCSKLNEINTTLPDSVIYHYMKKTGFVMNDPKLVKIISLASQKFIADIANDVMQHHRLKVKATGNQAQTSSSSQNVNQPTTSSSSSTNAATGASSNPNTTAKSKSTAASAAANNTALTLTLDDLTQVLTEYGINVKKPYYFM